MSINLIFKMRENLLQQQKFDYIFSRFFLLFLLVKLILIIVFHWLLKFDLPLKEAVMIISVGILLYVFSQSQLRKLIAECEVIRFQIMLMSILLCTLLLISEKWAACFAALIFPYLFICITGLSISGLSIYCSNKLALVVIIITIFLSALIVYLSVENELIIWRRHVQGSATSYLINAVLVLYFAYIWKTEFSNSNVAEKDNAVKNIKLANDTIGSHLKSFVNNSTYLYDINAASHVADNAANNITYNAANNAASIVHALATPLSTIAIITEKLHFIAKDNAQLKQYASDLYSIENQIKYCQSLIFEFNSQILEPLSLPIKKWFPVFIKQWQMRYFRTKLHFQNHHLPFFLINDVNTCGHILTILLDNAVRASPHLIDLQISFDNKQLIFSIEDWGTGWPDTLFDSLGKKPVASLCGGSGIGLHLAFAMAKKINGEIRLENRTHHQGARVIFCLKNS